MAGGGLRVNAWGRRNRANHPGEPLYINAELTLRLGLEPRVLQGLRHAHPGLVPWVATGERMPGMFTKDGAMRNDRFRMSDVKRWWATLPEDIRNKYARPA